jgi:hypothetical protein
MLSSKSSVIKAANSALAIFLRSKEDEEALLLSVRVKREKPETKLPSSRQGRFSAPPNFKSPSPLVDRPRSRVGATSFHFSYETISKTAVPIGSDGRPLDGPWGKQQKPVDHAQYIERDGAAEAGLGALHATYIERPGAAEARSDARVRGAEDPMDNENVGEDAAALSIFTNIPGGYAQRQDYWRAVEAAGNEPRTHWLVLDPEASPAWWQALPSASALDADFQEYALRVADLHRRLLKGAKDSAPAKLDFKDRAFACDAKKAGLLIEQVREMNGFDPENWPLYYKSGRGGQIQSRIVCELPHELSPKGRAEIAGEFCQHLGSLEIREIEGEKLSVGMMHTGVIHAPDRHNNKKNFHLHVVAHDRPATYKEGEGWDFEVTESYVTSSREKKQRFKYPRQNKIRAVNGKSFIPSLRRKFEEITNRVLKAYGVDRTVDARTYAEMGIDRTPTRHLGTRAAALEAIGVSTPVGEMNAIAIWSDAERAIKTAAEEERSVRSSQGGRYLVLAQMADRVHADMPEVQSSFQLIGLRDELVERIATERVEIEIFDLMETKAKSRAARTLQTCQIFLADIEDGTADKTTRRDKRKIEERRNDAQDHIAAIDAALAPHRDGIASAREALAGHQAEFEELTSSLEALVPVLQDIVAGRKFSPPPREPSPPAKPDPVVAIPIANPSIAPPPLKLPVPQTAFSQTPAEPPLAAATEGAGTRSTSTAPPIAGAKEAAPAALDNTRHRTSATSRPAMNAIPSSPIFGASTGHPPENQVQPGANPTIPVNPPTALDGAEPYRQAPAARPAEGTAAPGLRERETMTPASASESRADTIATSLPSAPLQTDAIQPATASREDARRFVAGPHLDHDAGPFSAKADGHDQAIREAANDKGQPARAAHHGNGLSRLGTVAEQPPGGPAENHAEVDSAPRSAAPATPLEPPSRVAVSRPDTPIPTAQTEQPSAATTHGGVDSRKQRGDQEAVTTALEGSQRFPVTSQPPASPEPYEAPKQAVAEPWGDSLRSDAAASPASPDDRESATHSVSSERVDSASAQTPASEEISRAAGADAVANHGSKSPSVTSVEPTALNVDHPGSRRLAGAQKEGRSMAAQSGSRPISWNDVFKKIGLEGLPIARSPVTGRFEVKGLSDAEMEVLQQLHFIARTEARLTRLYDIQEKEVGRVRQWIEKHGRDPQMLAFDGRLAFILPEAGQAMRTLFKKRSKHPVIKGFFEAESHRRSLIQTDKFGAAQAASHGGGLGKIDDRSGSVAAPDEAPSMPDQQASEAANPDHLLAVYKHQKGLTQGRL